MKKSTIAILAVIAVLAIWGVSAYNGLVRADENVSSAWGEVENTYQRRADLIPNLVATVKGYAEHEQGTLEAVVNARAKATQASVPDLSEQSIAGYQAAQAELSSALSRLLVVVENYPELKANENFLDLQAQLEGTENRIATARNAFNEAARAYNTQVRSFPGNIIAGIAHFQTKGYFEAAQGAAEAPKVEF